MNDIIVAILMAVLAILCLSAYLFCIRKVLPRYVLKRRYFINKHLGRGLKKYTSEDGRAVVYEPHPHVRKYIKKYALVARGGHKYLECSIDRAVKRISYTVIMLNNKDKVLDVVEVNDITAKMTVSHPVYLHEDTSYVALIVQSVNGETLTDGGICYYLARDIGLFALASAVLTFALHTLFSVQLDVLVAKLNGEAAEIALHLGSGLTSSLAVALASAVIILLYCSRKNLKVIFNGR